MLLELKDVNGDLYAQITEKQKQLLLYLHIYKKMELNLETIFQMSGKLILLLFVWSKTRTSQGKENKENWSKAVWIVMYIQGRQKV